MLSKKLVLNMIMAGLVASGLAACGGSSSGSGSASGSAAPATTEISGTAMAPGGAVAMFEEQGFFYVLGNFLIPTASAEITGLMPITGATVELIYIDDDGNQVGDVLATTTTSITGDYRLNLPAGVDFAANLVVRITGNSGFTLDAQVVSKTVDIYPVSDYVLDKLVENGTTLDTLAANEVVKLVGQAEEFDLTAGLDMTEMLAALEAKVGQFLDDNIESINAGEGDGALVAGVYHFGDFGIDLSDKEDESWGTFATAVGIGTLTLTDAGGGQLTGSLENDELESESDLVFDGQGTGWLFLSTELDDADVLEVFFDGSGAINLEWDFEEELDTADGTGWRSPPGTIRLAQVASSGIFVGGINAADVSYDLLDTDGDTIDDTLDPNAKLGDNTELSLMFIGRKSTGMDASALDGVYGIVGMDVSIDNGSGNIEVEAFFSKDSFDGNGFVTESVFDASIIDRSPNAAPVVSTDTFPANLTYTVADDGSMSLTDGGVTDAGFIVNGGNAFGVFVHESDDDGGNPATIIDVEHGMLVGVKLPVSQPDMTGRSYRMYSMALGFAATGTRVENVSGGEFSFNGDGTVNVSGDLFRGFERASDTSAVVHVNEPYGLTAANQSVTIDSMGSIDITAIADAEGSLKLDGYVSADGNLLILRSDYDGVGGEEAVGMFIGVKNP